MIDRIVGLLYQLPQDIMRKVLIKATLIVVRLCHRWVHTSWVDPLANLAGDIVYLCGLNHWGGRIKIRIATTKYICACIINRMLHVSCITLTLCSSSWTKLWQNSNLASLPGQQTMVDVRCGEGNECQVEFITQWWIFHSHLSYAMEVCPLNKIYNFNHFQSKLALLNWLSRQQLNKKGTLNVPYEHLWGMKTCPWPIARLPLSRSL